MFQWHLGMFANAYTPLYRGFESHFGYYQGCEDYYDHTYEADLVCQSGLLYTSTPMKQTWYVKVVFCSTPVK